MPLFRFSPYFSLFPRETKRRIYGKLMSSFQANKIQNRKYFQVALVCAAAARLSLSHIRVLHTHMIASHTHVSSSAAHIHIRRSLWLMSARAAVRTHTSAPWKMRVHIRAHRHSNTDHIHRTTQNILFFFSSSSSCELNEMRNAKHKTVLVRTRNEIAHWT